MRTNLLNGTLSAHELVRLSPIDLATSELRELRRAAQEEDCDARRTDWVEAHLSEIQEQNGLDPDNVWIYEEEPVSECD